MSATTIHQGLAYELSLEIRTTRWGHHLRFVSFVPTARNPQPMEQFQAHLSSAELRVLREAIDAALRESASAGIDTSRSKDLCSRPGHFEPWHLMAGRSKY
jgi:hypothetical protein